MALARVLHLAASYWGFVLMSIHIGIHWSMVTGMICRFAGGQKSVAATWIMLLIAVGIAVYGATNA